MFVAPKYATNKWLGSNMKNKEIEFTEEESRIIAKSYLKEVKVDLKPNRNLEKVDAKELISELKKPRR